MQPGKCNTFLDTRGYKDAVAKLKAAKSTLATADAGVSAAEKSLSQAKATAASLSEKCQCETVWTADKAFKAASASNAANTKAWTKAKHMGCVLDGVSASKCVVPATPKVQEKTLAAGVTCDREAPVPTKAPTKTPTKTP